MGDLLGSPRVAPLLFFFLLVALTVFVVKVMFGLYCLKIDLPPSSFTSITFMRSSDIPIEVEIVNGLACTTPDCKLHVVTILEGCGDEKMHRVLLEQLTAGPWNNMFFMMYYGLVVDGRPWGLVKNKVQNDWPSVQLAAWKFWPIVGWVNYQYMPIQFRVVFHSFVASCWGIFLNLKARSATIKKA